nr:xylulose kinase-1 [Tanacetum cinerariifolium]
MPHTDVEIISPIDVHVHHERIQKGKDKDEDSFAGSDRGLKKMKRARMLNQQKSEEPEFKVAYSDMPQDQVENLGNDDEEHKRKVASKREWFTKAKQPEDLTDSDWNVGKNPQQGPTQSWNCQVVPVGYFFNNDLKYLQGGILTMTYTTSITKTKATQYDLPGIKDMIQNIWSPIKVTYNKQVLWVTQVEVMRKHGYGYLREIELAIFGRYVMIMDSLWMLLFHTRNQKQIGYIQLSANVACFYKEHKPSAPSLPSNTNERNSPDIDFSLSLIDLSKLAIIHNRLKKIHSKGLTSGSRAFRELEIRRTKKMTGDDNHEDTNEMIKVLPPKTAKEVVARERERKARTTLLMALPEDHFAKFHKMADAKEM